MPTPSKSLERSEKEESKGLIRDFLTGLSFPVLFVLLLVLFIVDAFLPDPLPFIDEAILGTLAVLFGSWRRKRQDKKGRNEEKPSP